MSFHKAFIFIIIIIHRNYVSISIGPKIGGGGQSKAYKMGHFERDTAERWIFLYFYLIRIFARTYKEFFLFSALQCIDIRSNNFRLFDALCLVYSRQSEYYKF
jgi:hypothetical protein